MKEINIKDKRIGLDELKFEVDYGESAPSAFINLGGITKAKADEIRDEMRGNNPIQSFGKFDFEGSINFAINDFYITLLNVRLTTFKMEKRFGSLRITFKPMDGFGYVSGMGKSVLRDAALKDLLG